MSGQGLYGDAAAARAVLAALEGAAGAPPRRPGTIGPRPADGDERASFERAGQAERRAEEARARLHAALASAGRIPGLCHHGQRVHPHPHGCGACRPEAWLPAEEPPRGEGSAGE